MRRYLTKRNCSLLLVLIFVIGGISLCWHRDTKHIPLSGPALSTYTNIDTASCETLADSEDPHKIPYQVCPGVLGYTLQIRQDDSGSKLIDIIDPDQAYFSLAYEHVVTRSFLHLDNIALWRTAIVDTEDVPIALIVTVLAHENTEAPDQVTHSYYAIAKITKREICVTDKILKDSISLDALLNLGDTARERPCLEPISP